MTATEQVSRQGQAMRQLIHVLAAIVLLPGCAAGPDKIATTYISPLQYNAYDGEQIAGELERVNVRISELEGRLKKKADGDALKTTIGVVLFWPTLFFLDGNGPESQEYARLKGERDALEKLAIQKGYTVASTAKIAHASGNPRK
jgi:hypothetical protein